MSQQQCKNALWQANGELRCMDNSKGTAYVIEPFANFRSKNSVELKKSNNDLKNARGLPFGTLVTAQPSPPPSQNKGAP